MPAGLLFRHHLWRWLLLCPWLYFLPPLSGRSWLHQQSRNTCGVQSGVVLQQWNSRLYDLPCRELLSKHRDDWAYCLCLWLVPDQYWTVCMQPVWARWVMGGGGVGVRCRWRRRMNGYVCITMRMAGREAVCMWGGEGVGGGGCCVY